MRRALDLARDGATSVDDASDHLCRLALGQREELEAAERKLQASAHADATSEHAQLLLHHALELLPTRP